MNNLTIIGASGHGKVVADIARMNGYKKIVFADDNESIVECGGYPVVCKSKEAPEGEVFVAIGNPDIRRHLVEYYSDREQPVLIHPSAVVADGTEFGKGTAVMAGAVINPNTKAGIGCILNTSCSVDHDCILGNYVHISVGAHLSGTVTVGDNTWIGVGAAVSNNIKICDSCMIGAGAVVIRDIKEKGTYIGVPAKKKQSGEK